MRHGVWILALISAVVLPLASTVVPRIDLPISPQVETSFTFLPVERPQESVCGKERGLKPATTYLTERVLWIVGVTFLLVRLVFGTIAVRRMTKTAGPLLEESWLHLVEELSVAFRLRGPLRLMISKQHVAPMTWGISRHTVLLPASAAQWSDERRRLVLAHELAHVKRNDRIVQVFVQIVCSIYWFNPLVWYAAHRLCIERERACDDHVLRLGTIAADYADHLIQIVRGLRGQRVSSVAALSMAQLSQLETRLASILDSRASRGTLSKIGTVLLCVFTAVATMSIAALGIAAAVPLPPVLIAAMKSAPSSPAPQRTRIGNADTIPNNVVIMNFAFVALLALIAPQHIRMPNATAGIVPPELATYTDPFYSRTARDNKIEGTVTVEAAFDAAGKMRVLRVVKSLGYGLDESALDSLRSWRFCPALQDGKPVETTGLIDIDFALADAPASEFDDMKRVEAGMSPPTVLKRIEPQYTDDARTARIGGVVVLQAVIQTDGKAKILKIVRFLPLGLAESAIHALEQWTFTPAMRGGKAIPVSTLIEVGFNLEKTGASYPDCRPGIKFR
jgi:TonB family protein